MERVAGVVTLFVTRLLISRPTGVMASVMARGGIGRKMDLITCDKTRNMVVPRACNHANRAFAQRPPSPGAN
jgi:hypothetical protein